MPDSSSSQSTDSLIIPKLLQKVSLWVHPEGKVLGSLFIREQSYDHAGHELPVEILNSPQDFVVLKRENSEELRFYNKTSIVRIEYNCNDSLIDNNNSVIRCKIHMMDGSLLEGIINENLPKTHSRLFDYINNHANQFLKIHLSDEEFMLINKSYIIRVTPVE
ncbi:hypothetical protein MNBD_GAMMA22-677 [hydrothermal vent metagenome]|uniref:Uncharacterized protein n=1 Tax=hydrothermal vent metagenome TaxID=652676 RepID=A0A3B1A0Q2_9ZZZZ